MIDDRDAFLSSLETADSPAPAEIVRLCGAAANSEANYLDVIQSFDEAARNQVVEWLGKIVTAQQDRAQEVVDQLPLPF